MSARAESLSRVPAWLYALALPVMIGGLWASSLFVAIYAAFGLPRDMAERLEAALFVVGPVFLALIVVLGTRHLWQGGRRRAAVATLGFADAIALFIAGWWGGAI